jgi:restriction system protein
METSMSIPEFFYFIRPALEFHQDGSEHYWREVEKAAIEKFNLTAEDQEALIPSGRKTRLADRVQWALTYLRQAKLLDSSKRGYNRISPRGTDYLKRAPDVLTPTVLMEFPEFTEFYRSKPTREDNHIGVLQQKTPAEISTTPEESLAVAYEKLTTALALEILERVKRMPPALFEQLIVRLMLGLGYGGTPDSGRTLGRTGDEGVDGVINQDKLGLDKIYLQAKRWTNGTVGRKELQAFVGALSGQGADKGVFITTSTFSRDAIDYNNRMLNFKISLIDGLELARLMIENDLGVALVQRYDVKRIDSDFFAEE